MAMRDAWGAIHPDWAAGEIVEGATVDLWRDPFADPEGSDYHRENASHVVEITREREGFVTFTFSDINPVEFPETHRISVWRA